MSRTFKRTALAAAILTATLGLTACGSGSSSTDTSTTTTSGTAAKGIINAGVVIAQELDLTAADPFAADALIPLTETQTGETGSYSLELPDSYNGGPILLTLTTSATSEMKCDTVGGCGSFANADDANDILVDNGIIDFGEWYKPNVDSDATAVMMQTLIPAGSSTTISASITPFTNMAVARAKTRFSSDDSDSLNNAISNANYEVATLLNINANTLLGTQPIDITDSESVNGATSPEQVAYAAFSAAVANIAANNNQTLGEAITALANSFATGEMAIDDTDGANTISIRELVQEANDTLAEADTTDKSGSIQSMEDDADEAEANGQTTVNPEPNDTATASAVDKAKALVKDFRTYVNALNNTVNDPNFASSFAGEIDSSMTLLSNMETGDNPIAATAYGLQVIEAEINNASVPEATSINVDIDFATDAHDYLFTSGTLTVTATLNEDTDAYSGTIALVNASDGTRTGNLNGSISGIIEETILKETETTDESEGLFTLTNGTLSGDVTTPSGSLELNETAFNISGEYYDYVNYDEESKTYSDESSESIAFDFDSGATLTVSNESGTDVVYAGSFNIDAIFNSISSSTSTPEYWEYSENGQPLIKELSYTGSVTVGEESSSIEITLNSPNAFEFSNPETTDSNETEENFMELVGSLSFDVALADLIDPISVDWLAERTGLNTGSSTLTLTHGDRSIVIDGSATVNNDASIEELFTNVNGDITVSNVDGVELIINQPEEDSAETVIGTITVEGEEVATVENIDGVIKITYPGAGENGGDYVQFF
ncbi:hypothetical protein J3998_02720 [Thiomicrorhabdus sp. 6S2-11]|uniref:Lipoprotein n=1 Tax=Thiomicrorhabdus marina TaxID=2818442 RepID=A0ABS3Q2G7_9GAMM|nr:hypothetical protein [Thiomicrorhabdus marina]MBO1926476.1 hypothetical protein [Thiomicrorhabdus marina]